MNRDLEVLEDSIKKVVLLGIGGLHPYSFYSR